MQPRADCSRTISTKRLILVESSMPWWKMNVHWSEGQSLSYLHEDYQWTKEQHIELHYQRSLPCNIILHSDINRCIYFKTVGFVFITPIFAQYNSVIRVFLVHELWSSSLNSPTTPESLPIIGIPTKCL